MSEIMMAWALGALLAAQEPPRRDDWRGPRVIWTSGHGTWTVTTCNGWTPWGYTFRGPWVPGIPWWRGPVTEPYYTHFRPPLPMTAPAPLVRGVSDRAPELAGERALEEGRRRFRGADYAGARESFRNALLREGAGGEAYAHFALAVAALGDAKNAEKALRSAAARAPFAAIDLKGLFRDGKERARVTGLFRGLVAAWAEALQGEPDRLRGLGAKDVDAKRLLDQ